MLNDLLEDYNGISKNGVVHALTHQFFSLCGCCRYYDFVKTKKKVTCKSCLKQINEIYYKERTALDDYEVQEIVERHIVSFDEQKHSVGRLSNFPAVYDPWLDY